MQIFLILEWLTNPEHKADAQIVPATLIQDVSKKYYVKMPDGQNLGIDPYGNKQYSGNVGVYELCILTDKGLVYNPKWNETDNYYLVQIIQPS